MDKHLNAFIENHPEGWNHEEWLSLLTTMEQDGIEIENQEAIGYELENRRLAWELRRRAVPGLGPKRIDAVVGRFGTLWSLQHAEVEELAELNTIPGPLAEKVVAPVR